MQFIAEDPVHIVVRSELPALYDQKGRLVRERMQRLFAKFQRGGAPPYAVEIARQSFEFRKKPPGHPLESWLGFFDTEAAQLRNGWSDEERETVEQRLTVGITTSDNRFMPPPGGILRIEEPKLPAPWPSYDKLVAQGRRTIEMVAEKVAEKVREDGYDAAAVIAYERENLNREQVIAAVEALAVEEEEEPLVAA